MGLFDSRCKFYKHCILFRSDIDTCTKTGGAYYEDGRPAGCYRDLDLKSNNSIYWRN